MAEAVILRRPKECGRTKTGLGRYGDGIEHCLRDRSAKYIEMDLSMKRGVRGLLLDGIVRPFFQLVEANGRDSVCHATDELAGVLFPFVRGRRVLTVHHVITEDEWNGPFSIIWRGLTNYAIRKADTIISISDSTTEDLRDMGADMSKVVTIDNRVDPMFRRTNVVKKDVIGCVGQLCQRKNMNDAVIAFSELLTLPGMGGYVLRIVGRGPEEGKIRSTAEGLGISDRVEIVRDIDEEELVEFYNECRLIFNTSLHEGFGLVTLEAQACGTPTLHLAHAHIPEIVTRVSIPCASPRDMAERAQHLIADPAEYGNVCARSMSYVSDFNSGHCKNYRKALFGE